MVHGAREAVNGRLHHPDIKGTSFGVLGRSAMARYLHRPAERRVSGFSPWEGRRAPSLGISKTTAERSSNSSWIRS